MTRKSGHVTPLLNSSLPSNTLAQDKIQIFPEAYKALSMWLFSPSPIPLHAHGTLALPHACHPPAPGPLHWLFPVLGMLFPGCLRGLVPPVLQVSASAPPCGEACSQLAWLRAPSPPCSFTSPHLCHLTPFIFPPMFSLSFP